MNGIIQQWTGRITAADALAACEAAGAPCSKLLSIADIMHHPQYAARGNMLRVHDPRQGELVLPAPVPRLSLTPAEFRNAGPALGDATRAVLEGLLGLGEAEIAGLAERRVI